MLEKIKIALRYRRIIRVSALPNTYTNASVYLIPIVLVYNPPVVNIFNDFSRVASFYVKYLRCAEGGEVQKILAINNTRTYACTVHWAGVYCTYLVFSIRVYSAYTYVRTYILVRMRGVAPDGGLESGLKWYVHLARIMALHVRDRECVGIIPR